jgi:hypothetical protein
MTTSKNPGALAGATEAKKIERLSQPLADPHTANVEGVQRPFVVKFVAQRYRLPFPLARLLCVLADLGRAF